MTLDRRADPSRHPGDRDGDGHPGGHGQYCLVPHRERYHRGSRMRGRMEIIAGNGRMPGERPPPGGRGRLCGCAVRTDGPGSLDALISLNVCLKVAQS
jgi:hypothetical protein